MQTPKAVSQATPPVELGVGYQWRYRADDPDRVYLFKAGVQIGGWDDKKKVWRDYDSRSDHWFDPGKPPWQSTNSEFFFGVVHEKIPEEESYSIGGVKADRTGVRKLFAGDTLTDDSSKLRLTLIADKEVSERISGDLKSHPALANVAPKFTVQSYQWGDWATEVFRPDPARRFHLSLQGPANQSGRGIEYHAQTEYTGPEDLAVAMAAAIRKADPSYEPNRTPDLRPKPNVPPAPEPAPVDSLWTGLLIILFFIFALGKGNGSSDE